MALRFSARSMVRMAMPSSVFSSLIWWAVIFCFLPVSSPLAPLAGSRVQGPSMPSARLRVFPRLDVKQLHPQREGNSEIEVTPGNVEAEPIGHQRHADQ